MKHYCKISNGQVMGGPYLISSSPTESPNKDWGLNQMKLNGFLPTDIDYDESMEMIDFANPIVMEDKVVYPRLPANLNAVKSARIQRFRSHAAKLIRDKYQHEEITYVALGVATLTQAEAVNSAVQSVYDVLLAAISQVNGATTLSQVNSVSPNWPVL